MDSKFQKQLLDAFMSDYQRVYLVDLLENQIFMQVNSDKSNQDTVPWMQAAIDPTVSFEKFIQYYSEYSVEEKHREWFEKQMSPENIRTNLHGRNSFNISYPLISGDWRRIEVRRFGEGSGIATTALICIPFSSESDEKERFMPGDESVFVESRYDSDLDESFTRLLGSISACNVDVTDYMLLDGNFDAIDLFYPVSNFSMPDEFGIHVDNWLDKVLPESREQVKTLMSREYMLQSYELGNREPWIEYRTRDRFGNEVWLNQKLHLTRNEANGHIMCLVVVRDITDQVATRVENERRMSLIEGLTAEYSSVYFVDLIKNKYYIYRLAEYIRKRLEEGFFDSFDSTMEYFIENVVYAFDEETVREKILIDGIRKNLEGRRDYSFIFRAKTKKGLFYYRCMVVRIDKNEGEATEALVGFADVNEEQKYSMRQKQLLEDALEQARNAGKAKTMFLSNMSHDIRTPMNAIIGFAEIAQLHPDDIETVQDSLGKILSSGEHLLQLIDNILDISRIESGRLVLKEEPCSLRGQIDEVMDIFMPQINARKIAFTKVIADDVADYIFCDALKMKQLIINLMSNAVKYTPPEGKIEFRIENAEAPEGYAGVEMHLIDTGIGMSPAFIRKMFVPFEREENSAISQVRGSGLGMAICKGIVDAMGGTITAFSKQNEGTEIIVHLEFRLQDNTIRGAAEVMAYGPSEHVRYRLFNRPLLGHITKDKYRILLVEDNRMNREIAKKMLSHLGYEVSMAENGDTAVEIMRDAEESTYDLILMDVHMPGLSGYQTTEKIRNLGGDNTWIPIVAMTADAFESDVHHALRAGMNAFISKPVNFRTLQTVLDRFLGEPKDSEEEAGNEEGAGEGNN